MKNTISILIGAAFAFGLLFLMTNLIPKPIKETSPISPVIDLPTVVKLDVDEACRCKSTPKPPSASIEPSLEVSNITVVNTEISDIEPINLMEGVSTAFQLPELSYGQGHELGSQDRAAMVVYQTPAQYPMEARMKGTEGWVKLFYDVDKAGIPINIRVMDSEPNNIFDKEARRALKRWKFKATIENGIAVGIYSQAVTMEFKFDSDLAQK